MPDNRKHGIPMDAEYLTKEYAMKSRKQFLTLMLVLTAAVLLLVSVSHVLAGEPCSCSAPNKVCSTACSSTSNGCCGCSPTKSNCVCCKCGQGCSSDGDGNAKCTD
jgi:hypothetical protein